MGQLFLFEKNSFRNPYSSTKLFKIYLNCCYRCVNNIFRVDCNSTGVVSCTPSSQVQLISSGTLPCLHTTTVAVPLHVSVTCRMHDLGVELATAGAVTRRAIELVLNIITAPWSQWKWTDNVWICKSTCDAVSSSTAVVSASVSEALF